MGLEYFWKFKNMWLMLIEVFNDVFDGDFEVKMDVKVCMFLLGK